MEVIIEMAMEGKDSKVRIAVLISGRGSDLQSIIDACELGLLNGEVVVVISNKKDAYGLKRAQDHGIPWFFIDHRGKVREVFEQEMIEVIDGFEPDIVVLAGFMRRLTPHFVDHYFGKLINIHPALLPSFPGTHGQRDALEYGVKVSGCTVHFVTSEVDAGPIILQYPVFVHEDDDVESLAARILNIEHKILPLAIKLFAEGRLSIEGRRVKIKGFTEEELMAWMKLADEKGLK